MYLLGLGIATRTEESGRAAIGEMMPVSDFHFGNGRKQKQRLNRIAVASRLSYMLTCAKCMEGNVAYRGLRFTVVYAIRNDGSMPASEFFQTLETRWQARFLTLYTKLGDTGRVSNVEQFNKFVDEFWEFKAFRYRMPCYYGADRHVVITHGFIKKKEGPAPRQEGERARSIKQEYEGRLASVGRRTK